MSITRDPLRVCQRGCLLLAHHRYCPWHGSPLRPLVGLRLGNHRIERPLSTKGGFGAVYLARNVTQRDQEAAIKVLKPPHCYRPNIVKTFIYESGLGKGIQVGQIPKISDVAQVPWPHLKMEFIVGHPLEDELREMRGPAVTSGRSGWPDLEEAHGILIGIAKALQASHQVGLIHRDLKPLNILLVEKSQRRGQSEDWVKVIDWGIAMRILDETDKSSQSARRGDGEGGSTTVEFVNKVVEGMGSLPYMAPEHFQRKTGKYSDVYQFGIIAFELLTGQFPYKKPDENSVQAWHNVHCYQRPRNIRQMRRGIPGNLARVVHRCLEKDPARRYPDGEALLKEVVRKPLPRPVRYAMAGLLLAVIALGVFLVLKKEKFLLPSFFDKARGLESVSYESDAGAAEEEGDFEKPRCFWFRAVEQIQKLGAVILSPGRTLDELTLEQVPEDGGSPAPLGQEYFSRSPGSDSVELRFGRIGDFLENEIGDLKDGGTRRFVFASTGRVVQAGSSKEFRHRFSIAVDPTPPRVSSVRLLPSWEPKPKSDLLVDALDGDLEREARLFVPSTALQRSVTLKMTVEEENFQSADRSYVPAREGGSPLGVEISYEESGETRRLTPTPATVRGTTHEFEITLPDLPEPSLAGGRRQYVIRVTDKAQNQVELKLDLVLDSGLAVEVGSSLRKREKGQASLALKWSETYEPAPDRITLKLEDGKGAGQPLELEILDIVERPGEPGVWSVAFRLDGVQLQNVQQSPDARYITVRVTEPFFGGVSPPEAAVKPLRVVVERDAEPALRDFVDRIFLSLGDDYAEEKTLQLIPYPRFEDDERFVFESETLPRSIRIWQFEGDIQENGYTLNWESAKLNVAGPPIEMEGRLASAEDPGRGAYLEISLAGLLIEEDSLRFDVELSSLWGTSAFIIPITVHYSKRLPRFFETSLHIQKKETENLAPDGSYHVNGQEELSLVTHWRPTYRKITIPVQGLSGDGIDSRPIEGRLSEVEKTSARTFTHIFTNRQGEPLGEGIYQLTFELEDIFGNKETYQNIKVFNHGETPRIEIDDCQGKECEVRKGRDGSRFVVRLSDPSGITRIQLEVDGQKIVDDTIEHLLAPDGSPDWKQVGVAFEQVQQNQSHVTAVRLVYTDWKVGERKTITVRARDRDAEARQSTQTVTAVCTSEMLPDVVHWKGLDWIRIGGEKELESAFYICRCEVSRGLYADFDFYTDGSRHPGDNRAENLPVTDISPREMWDYARRNGCYLPTYAQWKKAVEGVRGGYASLVDKKVLAAVREGDLTAEERDFVASLRSVVHHPGTTSEDFRRLSGASDGELPLALVPVGREAESWTKLTEETYPGLFHSVLHLLGNAQEVVLKDESLLDAPQFQCIGGSYRSRLHNFLEPRLVGIDEKRSYRGMRLIVFHETRTEKGKTWEANEQFQEALQEAQSE